MATYVCMYKDVNDNYKVQFAVNKKDATRILWAQHLLTGQYGQMYTIGNPIKWTDTDPVATDRVDLVCPFEEKDAAKALGAKWDNEKKVWYAPKGANLEMFGRWLPERILADAVTGLEDVKTDDYATIVTLFQGNKTLGT